MCLKQCRDVDRGEPEPPEIWQVRKPYLDQRADYAFTLLLNFGFY